MLLGYSCKDLSFRGVPRLNYSSLNFGHLRAGGLHEAEVLENLLESCYVPKAKVSSKQQSLGVEGALSS